MTATTAVRGATDLRVAALVSGAHFFSHFYILALAPLFPVLHDDLGFSMAQLGLLLAALNLVTMAAQPFLGVLVDRVGAPVILIAGQALFALALGSIAFVSSYGALVALMLCAGLGNAVYHPADYAILSHRMAPERMARAFSVHTFGGYAGFAAAPAVMVGLHQLIGWRGAFLIVGLCGLAMAAILALYRHELTSARGNAGGGRGARGSAGASNFSLWTSWPIVLALLFFFALAMTHAGFTSFGVVVLQRLFELPLVDATWPVTLYLTVSAGGVLLGGWIADRTGRFALIVTCSALTLSICALAIVASSPGYGALLGLFVTAGLAAGVVAPSRDMLVRSVTPPGASGRTFGFVMIGFNIGGLTAPPIFGLLVDGGHTPMVMLVVAAFSLLSILTMLRVRAQRPTAPTAQAASA